MSGKGLTARKIASESRAGYHADGAQRGLYLQVTQGLRGTTRSWVFRYMSPTSGKRRDMGLGSTSIRTLAQAREAAQDCRGWLVKGIDPIDERARMQEAQRLAAARTVTFDDAVAACITSRSPEWRNAKHAAQWQNTMATYASPILGSLSVAQIDTSLVMRVLEPIWTTKTETATRVRQRIETILDWATARGLRSGPNPAALKGNLGHLLPKSSKTKKVKHHPALPYRQIHDFVAALRKKNGLSALALEFLILTAARTGEVIRATWDEIDTTSATWTLKASRMKSSREHRVPLTKRALAIIKELETNKCNQYVFPCNSLSKAVGLSTSAMLEMMRDMQGYDEFVPHGFRSTFRDWAAECTSFPYETTELALAHTIKNKTEAAYRRGDQLEKRRKLMEAWAAYIETKPRVAATVTQLPLSA